MAAMPGAHLCPLSFIGGVGHLEEQPDKLRRCVVHECRGREGERGGRERSGEHTDGIVAPVVRPVSAFVESIVFQRKKENAAGLGEDVPVSGGVARGYVLRLRWQSVPAPEEGKETSITHS